MPTRRDALRAIAALPILPAAAQSPSATAPPAPGSFTKDELDVLARLVDLIIPRTDTPGASDARVHLLIDEDALHDPGLGATLRKGISPLQANGFLKLPEADQATTLTRLSESGDAEERDFFKVLKHQTIDAYYGTQEGLAVELGWHGSVPLMSFAGCTHPEHQKLD